MGHEAAYEREGDVNNVVLPCGFTLGADGDAIHLYNGAADTSIALTTGSVRSILSWLSDHGSEKDDLERDGDRRAGVPGPGQ